eukprot:3934889-Rhodomonas_salina.3
MMCKWIETGVHGLLGRQPGLAPWRCRSRPPRPPPAPCAAPRDDVQLSGPSMRSCGTCHRTEQVQLLASHRTQQ